MLKNLSKRTKNNILFTIIIAVGVLFDQITKLLAVAYLKPIGDFPIIEGVFHFTYTQNPGAAFGMLSEHRWIFMTFSSVMIVAMGIYLFYPKKQENRLFNVAVSMVIAGGIGNMIDRIALEYVVDFIYFKLIDFPMFNIADTFVCVGAGIMILALVLDLIREAKKKRKE